MLTLVASGSAPHAGPLSITARAAAADGANVEATDDFTAYIAGRPGELDTSFGAASVFSYTPFPEGEYPELGQMAIDSAGGALLALTHDASGTTTAQVVRIGVDGTLDTEFAGSGVLSGFGGENSQAHFLLIRGDQFDVITTITPSLGDPIHFARRFNADGAVDTSFGIGGDVELPIRPRVVAKNGDGLFIDDFTTIVSIDADGAVNSSFTPATPLPFTPVAIAATQTGGVVGVSIGFDDFRTAQYTSSGALDATFAGDGILEVPATPATHTGSAAAVALYGDGSGVVAGANRLAATYNGQLFKFTPEGTLDSSFGTGGRASFPAGTLISGMLLQNDGRVITAASASDGADPFIARHTATGLSDTGFGIGGSVSLGAVTLPTLLAYDRIGERLVTCSITNALGTSQLIYTVRCVRIWL